MTEYEMQQLPIAVAIKTLYLPHSSAGYLNITLRNGSIRRCTIESGTHFEEWFSVVDLIEFAGYQSAQSNWRNIIKCYFDLPFYAPAWSTIERDAKIRFLSPKITSTIHGKTAVVKLQCAITILSRLPSTKAAAIADLHSLHAEAAAMLRRFEGCQLI